jgi:guanylate kinase
MKKFDDVYVVIAPSGTGKTTLNRRLTEENSDKLEMSISYTTRPMREGEIEGEHYHFVSKEDFLALVENNKMLEWAEVHGNYYGTPINEIERISALGKKSLLEIDIQGWLNAKILLPGAKSIFIMPPSIEAMWERLENRGTDNLKVRLIRLDSAKTELQGADACDYFIINDNIEDAYQILESAIIRGIPPELEKEKAVSLISNFLDTIDNADWLKKIRKSIDH